MGPNMNRAYKTTRLLKNMLLLLLALPLLFSTGCSTPCEQLSQLVCKELKEVPRLCTIAKQESKLSDVSQRHCRALVATWKQTGQKQIQTLNRRYREYKQNAKKSYKNPSKLTQELDRTEFKIRMRFRKLLRLRK